MAEQASNKEYQALKEDLAKLRADMEDLLTATAGEQRRTVKENIARAKARGETALGRARDTAQDSIAAVEHSVETHPMLSLLAAFGAGFMIGQLIRRR